ncbi:MAG: Fibronectin type III domain-containing protein [bacterium]|nr:MAG: Fibronectin type III domain-containing protein [bacterium]
MKLHRLLLVAMSVAITQWLFSPTTATAVPFDGNPKILLHLRPVTMKNACTTFGSLTDCQAAVTEGVTGQTYFAYVLAARGNLPSVAGAQFGIEYETGCPENRNNGSRIDIFSWTLCATLEFITPTPLWMSPGGGNLVIWDAVNRCQTGEAAVAGYFYLTCYSGNDLLEIVPRPVDGVAKLADCNSVEFTLPTSALGKAAFSAGGATPGCNPCDGPCAPPSVTGCIVPPDLVPPNPVADLMVIATSGSSITIRWTTTGDDGNSGQATALDIRYSPAPITEGNFNMATGVISRTTRASRTSSARRPAPRLHPT